MEPVHLTGPACRPCGAAPSGQACAAPLRLSGTRRFRQRFVDFDNVPGFGGRSLVPGNRCRQLVATTCRRADCQPLLLRQTEPARPARTSLLKLPVRHGTCPSIMISKDYGIKPYEFGIEHANMRHLLITCTGTCHGRVFCFAYFHHAGAVRILHLSVARIEIINPRRPEPPEPSYQFLVLSTILPAEIHGIISRRVFPICSIWCWSFRRRVPLK